MVVLFQKIRRINVWSRQILAKGEQDSNKKESLRSLSVENVIDIPLCYALEVHRYISAEGLFLTGYSHPCRVWQGE